MASKKAAKGPSKARSKKQSVKDLSPRAGKSKGVVGGATIAATTILKKPALL